MGEIHDIRSRVADSPEPDGGPVVILVSFCAIIFGAGMLVGAILW